MMLPVVPSEEKGRRERATPVAHRPAGPALVPAQTMRRRYAAVRHWSGALPAGAP